MCPSTTDPLGAVEIRKRCRIAYPTRSDARVAYYFAVHPFMLAPSHRWEGFLEALLRHSHPVDVSIGLAPITLPDGFSRLLHTAASQYAALATERRMPGLSLYRANEQVLLPDPFAVTGKHLFEDALRRYHGNGFACRVQMCSPKPIPAALAYMLAAAVSLTDGGGDARDTQSALTAAAVVERPQTAGDLTVFLHNLRTLDHQRWGGDPAIWDRPDPPHPYLAVLAFVVDAREALSAFRLPVAELTPTPACRYADPRSAGRRSPSVAVGRRGNDLRCRTSTSISRSGWGRGACIRSLCCALLLVQTWVRCGCLR